jgi:hypothetical protein
MGVGLALAAGAAHADRNQALADFNQGKQFQAARQWRPAILAYDAALKADPGFFYAYKALGTVYYMAGDHRGALSFYDLYLRQQPGDAATRAFAAGIRATLTAPAPAMAVQKAIPAAAASPASKAGPALAEGFDVRAFLAGVMDSGSDLAADFPGTHVGSCVALGGGLGVDYGWNFGPVLGADVLIGPSRSHSLAAGNSSATATISSMGAFLSGGWRFVPMAHVVLEPRLGLGLLSSSLQISGSPDSASGIGYGFWPELRGEYEVGNWGLGLSLGYLSTNTASLTDTTSGQALVIQGNSVSLATGGPSFSLFAVYHFQPLLP